MYSLTAAENDNAAISNNCGDLAFARKLANRDPEAIRTFERELAPELEAAARKAGADDAMAAEVRQQVTIDVLIGDTRGPRIAQYEGRGDLRGWLRSIAARATWRLRARANRDHPLDEDGDLALVDDPMIARLRERYADELARAVQGAMAALTPRQRTLLRLAYLDGLTTETLGRMYCVHPATAARWVAGAREALVELARDRLESSIDAGLTSVARLVRSAIGPHLAGMFPP
jgi:RNA polymerase sigma-70 factor (ECF subfamily)